MTPQWLLSLACAFAGAAAAAEPCETLRAQIEAKIVAAGVTHFTVTTVDAGAAAAGQVVGSCELGSKKIVYQREQPTGAEAAPANAPARESSHGGVMTDAFTRRGRA